MNRKTEWRRNKMLHCRCKKNQLAFYPTAACKAQPSTSADIYFFTHSELSKWFVLSIVGCGSILLNFSNFSVNKVTCLDILWEGEYGSGQLNTSVSAIIAFTIVALTTTEFISIGKCRNSGIGAGSITHEELVHLLEVALTYNPIRSHWNSSYKLPLQNSSA